MKGLELIARMGVKAQNYGGSGGTGGQPILGCDVSAALAKLPLWQYYLSLCFVIGEDAHFRAFLKKYSIALKQLKVIDEWPVPTEMQDLSKDQFIEAVAHAASYDLIWAQPCTPCGGKGMQVRTHKTCAHCKGRGKKIATNTQLRNLVGCSRYEWDKQIAGGDKRTWKNRIEDLTLRLQQGLSNVDQHLRRELRDTDNV